MREKLVEITPEIEAVLLKAKFDGRMLVLTGKLDRKLYVKVANVLLALGGQWRRKEGAHVFAGDAGAIVTKALARGSAVDEKRTFEAFDTPPELAALLVGMADVHPGEAVLEPSAGRGSIVQALIHVGAHVHCVEIDPKAVVTLRSRFSGTSVCECDFLDYRDDGWKRIVMNPPFSRQQAVDHVSHALDLLAPGGTLVSVMPAGVVSVRLKKTVALRERLDELDSEFIYLPEGSFKASGTSVRAVVLIAGGDVT